MSFDHYSDAKMVSLYDYIETEKFRTVEPEQFKDPYGMSEIPVVIVVKETFAKTLSFPVPWDGVLYGFAIRTGETMQLLKSFSQDEKVLKIDIQDWDSKFLLVIESTEKEYGYYVKSTEVKYLLENCRRPEAQASRY